MENKKQWIAPVIETEDVAVTEAQPTDFTVLSP